MMQGNNIYRMIMYRMLQPAEYIRFLSSSKYQMFGVLFAINP